MKKSKMWGDKYYNNLNYSLKKRFGEKVYKLSVDGGFTCPNRDGTISNRACIFCSESGSGDFAGDRRESIKEQIEEQKKVVGEKYKGNSYIAYFQNFTGTYGSIKKLRKLYYEALECDGIVGIAIATRPDCLDKDVLNLLSEINKKTYLWIELGLQTIHNNTAKLINRGYNLEVFEKAFYDLRDRKIECVVHMIIGLPNESVGDIMGSFRYISKLKPSGIKIHLLHILKGTNLLELYKKKSFKIFELEEYILLVCDILEMLDDDIIIQRLTGDAPKSLLVEPMWSGNKRAVLNGIQKEMRRRVDNKFYL